YPSSKITDAWVYANNEFIGAFELPATVPILASGETSIIVYAGIKENGISGTGMIYPFYNGYTITKNLVEGITDTIFPSTTYKPSTAISFLFRDRFEIGNSFEAVESNAELNTTSNPELVFEGVRSAITTMTDDLDTFRVGTRSDNPLFFPTIDHQLFLEIDYMADISYNVWLKCITTGGSTIYDELLTITPKDYWNKIYVNLNPALQFFAQYQPESYILEFRAYNTTSDTTSILFDNLKIIQSN
ncbi:MAG: hypothetical protein ACHQFW_12065, partial [Chitinophagales bacterium]